MKGVESMCASENPTAVPISHKKSQPTPYNADTHTTENTEPFEPGIKNILTFERGVFKMSNIKGHVLPTITMTAHWLTIGCHKVSIIALLELSALYENHFVKSASVTIQQGDKNQI